jgi:16S rRNA processing protein RimM
MDTETGGSPSDPPFVVVAQVSKPHGTKGELFVWPLTDYPETTFVPGVHLQVADASGNLPDPAFEPVRIDEVRPYRKGYLLMLDGVEDRSDAERLHGRYLVRPFEEIEPLDEGEVFYHQLLGMTVVTADGEEVGEVLEVYHLQPVDLIEVRRGDSTILLPFQAEVVRDWDLASRRLVITPPEGLLDLQG